MENISEYTIADKITKELRGLQVDYALLHLIKAMARYYERELVHPGEDEIYTAFKIINHVADYFTDEE